ncbi:MAG: MerR family DNA-binding transcriptional regulator [Thiothrix sp.]
MDRYVAIGEASVALGVSITTLRRWEAEGKLISCAANLALQGGEG